MKPPGGLRRTTTTTISYRCASLSFDDCQPSLFPRNGNKYICKDKRFIVLCLYRITVTRFFQHNSVGYFCAFSTRPNVRQTASISPDQ